MILTKLKIGAALALVVALLGGAGTYFSGGWAAEPGDGPKAIARAGEKPAAADKAKGDNEAIQGTWLVSGVETGGKEAPDDGEIKQMKSAKWVVTAGKITLNVPGQGEHNVSIKLDPTKTPKEIDITPLDGPENEKGKLISGVYSLDGDVLKICMPALPHPDRPIEVATKAGGDAMLFTLKRHAPAKDKPKEDKPAADKEAIRGTWVVTALATDGKDRDDPEARKVKGQTWVFTADTITLRLPAPPGRDGGVAVCSYTLDPTQKPAMLDITPSDGADKGKTTKAVYTLKGPVLKICHGAEADAERPKEVGTKEGSKTTMLTLIREGVDADDK